MDQSTNRHNSLTLGGRTDREGVENLSGGEYSLFAMQRNRAKLIELLKSWENSKKKMVERKIRDKEKEEMVNLY